MRISFSSLEAFQICPLKYKFAVIDKLKEPKTKELIFGSYIHQVLKWIYSQDPHFPTLDQSLDYYHKNWPKEAEGYKWIDENCEKDYFEEGLRIISQFYQHNFPPKTTILDLETKFEAIIDETPNKPDGKHILTGRIDRLDKHPDGTIEIIDYKTNKKIPSQDNVDHNLQLSIYTIGLLQKWPKIQTSNIKLSLYFVKSGEKVETKRDLNSLREAEQKIINLIHQIEVNSFAPRPSKLCDYCGFKYTCPVWRHFYDNFTILDSKDINIKEIVDEYFNLQSQKEELEQKLEKLKNTIEAYSEEKGLERIYGTNGYFSRRLSREIKYDFEKIHQILEPLGKWEKVLEINHQKLQDVLKEIPLASRQEIDKAKIIEKEYKYFTGNNKIPED
ncbi:MAG: ATP-dependent helicase/deoxyribonuclease subunit B [Parcubacteria group bacterium ADurb.Bin305]|nr:MAG: ATP-dependent helicase/deoxyribonuclease subunit B [Parcubacteria group bacterium ADurb.Bin305]